MCYTIILSSLFFGLLFGFTYELLYIQTSCVIYNLKTEYKYNCTLICNECSNNILFDSCNDLINNATNEICNNKESCISSYQNKQCNKEECCKKCCDTCTSCINTECYPIPCNCKCCASINSCYLDCNIGKIYSLLMEYSINNEIKIKNYYSSNIFNITNNNFTCYYNPTNPNIYITEKIIPWKFAIFILFGLIPCLIGIILDISKLYEDYQIINNS